MLKKVLIALGAIALILFIFFNFVLEGIVKNKLQSMLKETFGTYYDISFQSNYTSLTPSGFSIGFSGVDLKTDTTDKYMMSKFAPVFFSATNLQVNNISVSNLLLNSDIDIGTFILEDPDLVFLVGKNASSANNESSKDKTPTSEIKEIETRNFQLIGGSAAFVFAGNLADTLYAGRDLNVSFQGLDILIDSAGVRPNQITVDQVDIDLHSVLYNPKSAPYKYQMEQMSINYQDKKLICKEIDLIPKKSLYAMTLKEKYQKTMFDIAIGEFELTEINFDSLKNDMALRASSGHLRDAKFTLLRNANYPLDPSDKVLMNESLANSSFPIDLDTLFIENALIDYRLVPKGKTKEGQVLLKNINGHLSGVYSEEHKKDTLKLSLNSDFMEHGKFYFAADFPLHGVPEHTYHGHISQLPFTDLNAIVTPMVGVQMNSGQIEDIYFTGVCTDRINSGQMIFDYDNLKLQVNNKKKGKRNWLISDIGNLIVRHQSKKDKDGRSKAVAFTYERPLYQGHIGFYLNGLLDGMMKNLLPGAVYKAAIKGMTPKAE